MMDRAERDEWITALRSGEFVQGRYGMAGANPLAPNEGIKYCCLGVKAELDVRGKRHSILKEWNTVVKNFYFSIIGGHKSNNMPTAAICTAWGLDQRDASRLAFMNDGTDGDIRRHTFPEIAQWIEDNL